MNYRVVWLLFGSAFSITLAIVVGQRLSAEAMAVIIGVVAGVAASIPTSLLVAWFALRASNSHQVIEAPSRRAESSPEPRIVVVAQPPQAAPAYQHYAGMAPQTYHDRPPAAGILPPRQFTVIGGDASLDNIGFLPEQAQEVVWQR
jgi:hypothetical protein